MCRIIMSGVLFAIGTMLAFDVAGSYRVLSHGITRNSLTTSVTTFLDANGPEPLMKLVQDVLLYTPLSAYAFLSGLIASLALGAKRTKCGVVFWIGYAVGFAGVVGQLWATKIGYKGVLFLTPSIIGASCAAPIYLVGSEIAAYAQRGRQLTFTITQGDCTGNYALKMTFSM